MNSTKKIENVLEKLHIAISEKRSLFTLLRLWSGFIRLRDGNRCVVCHSTERLSAHHICRKSFLPEAQLQSGNGITLCRLCHMEIHKGFNGQPDLAQPMDAQGGEKIEKLYWLFGVLVQDAFERQLLGDDFYYLSDSALAKFKMFQGFDPSTQFPGCRLQQALFIWRECPQQVRNALLKANGFSGSQDPQLSSLTIYFDK